MEIKKRAKRLCEIIILFYIASLAFLFFYQRNLMYLPMGFDLQDPSVSGIEDFELVNVTTRDDLDIRGWYKPPALENAYVVVFFHGNGVIDGPWYNKLRTFMENGYGAFYAEYRGYGGNPGNPTEQGLYNDARAYLNWLMSERSIPPGRIILYGESLGTGVAVQMATEYNLAAIILESPFTSTADVAKLQYFFYPVEWVMKDQYRSIDKIKYVSEPMLVVHGDQDRTVPYRFGRELFEAAEMKNKSFYTSEGKHHESVFTVDAYREMLSFLRGLENSDPIAKDM